MHWTVFVSRASLPQNVAKSARTLKPRLPERLVGNAAKPALTSAMTPRHVIRILRIDIRLYTSSLKNIDKFVVLYSLTKLFARTLFLIEIVAYINNSYYM